MLESPVTTSEFANQPSDARLRLRSSSQGLPRTLILLFLPARFLFAFIAQGVAAGVLAVLGSPAPWKAAAGWWMVSGTITDLLCLLALRWLLKREGRGLKDLFGLSGRAALRQLAWTPAYLLVLLPAAAIPALIERAFYGSSLSPMFTAVDLPLGWGLYAVLVWPAVWAFTEEIVYLGYLLPRLEMLWGRTWPAAAAVIFFWGVQHFAMPFIADPTYLTSRVLSALTAAAGMTLVFLLWRRRLVAMIGVHYLLDLATAVAFGLLPALKS
jgi:membrane protease YdiL (CAAX protease family)